jgi:hypothetical protein
VEGHYHPFCWEIKAHREIDFSHLLIPEIKNVKIHEFWAQCRRDAEKCNKVPMLLMRYDRLPSDFFFLGIPTGFYIYLSKKLTFSQFPINRVIRARHTEFKNNITVVDSREFFKTNYKVIKELTKQYLKNA